MDDFERAFSALTGREPYRWQRRAFRLLVEGKWEDLRSLSLPTGVGKTSLIACFLLAQAFAKARLPRRIVWIVNRRTVVDQATAVAEGILRKLADAPELQEVRKRLSTLSGDRWPERPVAVSTLRGERADNGEWAIDPSRPAILVGTVDMIGSRLLFRGYGCGRWRRPQHAGLLGIDSFVVLDEAHLEPAFDALLNSIEEFQAVAGDRSLPPTWICRASATLRTSSSSAFSLIQEDREDERLGAKLKRPKPIEVVQARSLPKTLVDQALRLGRQSGKSRILVFVENPETAAAVAREIGAHAKERTLLLTGELRGKERDGLPENRIYQAFARPERPQLAQSVFLVATSAGEVGADLYGDHGVCDLTTAESMLQRLGRIGRSGETAPASIVVVTDAKAMKNPRRAATLDYLENTLNHNASLDRIALSPPHAECFREAPLLASLDRITLDALAATSVRLPPHAIDLDVYLHGVEPSGAPECYVAWREDVQPLSESAPEEIEEVLDFYPVRPAEMLRTTVDRLRRALAGCKGGLRCLVQYMDGSVESPLVIEDLRDPAKLSLRGALVLLPTEAKVLDPEHGCLLYETEKAPPVLDAPVVDAADEGGERCRYLLRGADGEWRMRRLAGGEEVVSVSSLREAYKKASASLPGSQRKILRLSSGDDADERVLLYLARSAAGNDRDRYASGGASIFLDDHQAKVKERARVLAAAVELPPPVVKSEEDGGARHDDGKSDPVWQEAFGDSRNRPVAKPIRPGGALGGFRHELRSIEAAMPELTAHLIAAHHGWARPYFTAEAAVFEPKEAFEAQLRFAKLQALYGHWGLAYLESILRAADAMVSEEERTASALR